MKAHRHYLYFFAFLLLVAVMFVLTSSLCAGEMVHKDNISSNEFLSIHKKINFVVKGKHRTSNPAGWDEYDGTIYDAKRGYGWLTDLSGKGRDRGDNAGIELVDGTMSSPEALCRLELANWQGFADSQLNVFRIDLPNGWYKVTATSVDPGCSLPLVDLRCFKCRAHDVVFAGANYGAPLTVGGNVLIEGSGIVEVMDGYLLIAVGDPAYGGWTWSSHDPWYSGWKGWLGHNHKYANGWYQKFTRTVDPGFHMLRLNSLEIEQVPVLKDRPTIIFRDYFSRVNSQDINSGIANADRWVRVRLNSETQGHIHSELYQTSIKLSSPKSVNSVMGLLQQRSSPENGIVRYSTRVSLFTGAGSRKHSGVQEAGILMLAEPSEPTEFNSTFVGVIFDSSRSETMGWLIYRVGDGNEGYRTNLEVPDTFLPFKITEGEFEIIVVHDVNQNVLVSIKVNDVDVTSQWPLEVLKQRNHQGLYGFRSLINSSPSVSLKQFYWFYRVEKMN